MAGVKLTGFRGTAPKISPELLPDQGSQIARNCKLYSGDLIPYPEPVVDGSTDQSVVTQTIYPLRDDNDDLVWLSWEGVVDIATPSFSARSPSEQRFYYTGDGIPKVSTFDLATSGGAPYPNDYYDLGLQLPDAKLVTTAATFSKKAISTYSRDAGNTATMVTTAAHGLRSGMNVAISGFTYLTGTYSRTGTQVTITINGHGIPVGSTLYVSKTSGNLTDGVYTIVTATANTLIYNETESGATSGNVRVDLRGFNTPSSDVTVIDDNTFSYYSPGFEITSHTTSEGYVDLSGQPTLRTYTYTWYTPWGEESVGADPSENLIVREGQTITVTNIPHSPPAGKNFVRGVRLYRTLASNNVGEYYLLKTLWFPQQTASMSRSGNVVTMTIGEPHNFIEDDRFKISGLTVDATFNAVDAIVTDIVDDYTFKFAQTGADVAEFTDTAGVLFHDVAEKEDDDARYWGDGSYDFTDDFDPNYLVARLTSDNWDPPPEDLAGLKVVQNNILAGFVGKKLYFSEPDEPHAWPIDYEITLDYNIVAVEPISGIGVIVLTEGYPYLISGSDPSSMSVARIDALYPCLSARSVVAMNYGIVWVTHGGLAVYSASSGPKLLTDPAYEQDTWNEDFDTASFVATMYEDAYFASHTDGSIVVRQDQQGVQFVNCDESFDSVFNDRVTNKLYYTKDATGDVYLWDDTAQPKQTMEWKSKVITTKDYTNLGAARVVADYPTTVQFKFWVDRELVYDQPITTKLPFRLPTGYRSDTFEFSITGDIRIRAVHLAETPLGLKEA